MAERQFPPIVPFHCPDCGKTVMLVEHKCRLRCPDCAAKYLTEKRRKRYAERKKEINRKLREKRAAEKEREEVRSVFAKMDDDFNKKIEKTVKAQCCNCRFHFLEMPYGRPDNVNNGYCEYFLKTGTRVRKAEDGECLSFQPKTGARPKVRPKL